MTQKEHAVSFLKHHTVVTGSATIKMGSDIEYTIVAGQDENSVVQAVTICKNGLIVLSNSETSEFWSNYKPITVTESDEQYITFETP